MLPFRNLIKTCLTICAITSFSGCASVESPQLICPQLDRYTVDQQNQLANELEEMIRANSATMTRLFIVHYRTLRARLQAAGCQ